MCGICGFTGVIQNDVLRNMTGILAHRGPDEESFYENGRINMGSRRLSIVDLYTGHQPIHNEDKSIWLVWNGEIYNYKELREELRSKGHTFYTEDSDSEVIIHLYEEYGQGFVHRLNGMFAIALWDDKCGKLLLVRDRMGVKPLFYAQCQKEIVFASELKSILAHPLIKKEMDHTAIYNYFTFKAVPAPLTAFKNIYALMPGEMLKFENEEKTTIKYWKLDFSRTCSDSPEEMRCKILALLEDASRIRMRSDVPVGAYLSGGVDSSSVVALMSKHTDKQVKTFTLGYENKFDNKEQDLYYARKMSELYGTKHYEYIMSSKELLQDIDSVISSFDQPFSGAISTYFLTKLISKHVKVALSGDGADEMFGSYLSHRLAQPMEYYSRQHGVLRDGQLSIEQQKALKPFENNLGYLEQLYKVSKGEIAKWKINTMCFSDTEKDGFLTESFREQIGYRSNDAISKYFNEVSTAKDPLNRTLEHDWDTLLPDQVFAFSDFLSMAHSVEVRSPYVDYRLAEYVASIPGSMKMNNGNIKALLKETLSDLLPDYILNRKKEGFVLPIYNWLYSDLKEYVFETLTREKLLKHKIIKVEYVDKLLQDYYYGSGGESNALAARIWNLVMFQRWYESYI